jgi:hypothetical protein
VAITIALTEPILPHRRVHVKKNSNRITDYFVDAVIVTEFSKPSASVPLNVAPATEVESFASAAVASVSKTHPNRVSVLRVVFEASTLHRILRGREHSSG